MNTFKSIRERSGMSQKEVAITLKVTTQAISYWETGERMPSYDKLLALADLYNVSTDELLGRTPPSMDGLAADENRLIRDYRGLSAQGREYIRQQMQIAASVYKKSSDLPIVETVK